MTLHTSIADFDAWAIGRWGATRRRESQILDSELPRIQDHFDWSLATSALKRHLAELLLRESTPHCMSYCENGDVRWFIHNFGREIKVNGPCFDGRRVPATQAALMLLAHTHFNVFEPPERREESGDLNLIFGMGGSALAALHILSQIEYLFRVNSTFLEANGTVKRPIPSHIASLHSGLNNKGIGARIDQLQCAFLLYLHGDADPLRKAFSELENDLSISSRLSRMRNPAMHGELGDLSAEGIFYAMLLAMFYYSHLPPASAESELH